MKMTLADTVASPVFPICQRFADNVKERTKGAAEIQVYGAGQLGSQANALTSLQTGNFGSLYTVRVSDGTTTLTSSPAVALTVAVSQPISSPGLNGSKFSLSFNTEVGPSYVIDTTTNLAPANWVPVSTNAGTGGLISVTNAISSTSQGFYRVRLQ
jgi:hypothetical protein